MKGQWVNTAVDDKVIEGSHRHEGENGCNSVCLHLVYMIPCDTTWALFVLHPRTRDYRCVCPKAGVDLWYIFK